MNPKFSDSVKPERGAMSPMLEVAYRMAGKAIERADPEYCRTLAGDMFLEAHALNNIPESEVAAMSQIGAALVEFAARGGDELACSITAMVPEMMAWLLAGSDPENEPNINLSKH